MLKLLAILRVTAQAYQNNTTNNDQRVAAVAGHESVHATDVQNQQQSVDSILMEQVMM